MLNKMNFLKGNIRKQYSHLDDKAFHTIATISKKNYWKCILKDTHILNWVYELKHTPKSTNLSLYKKKIKRNKIYYNRWKDELLKITFKIKLKEQLKKIFEKDFYNPEINEWLYTSRFSLNISWWNKSELWEKYYSYHSTIYKDEEEIENFEYYDDNEIVFDSDKIIKDVNIDRKLDELLQIWY